MSPLKLKQVNLPFPLLSVTPTWLFPALVPPAPLALAPGRAALSCPGMAAGFPASVIRPQALKPPGLQVRSMGALSGCSVALLLGCGAGG